MDNSRAASGRGRTTEKEVFLEAVGADYPAVIETITKPLAKGPATCTGSDFSDGPYAVGHGDESGAWVVQWRKALRATQAKVAGREGMVLLT